MKRLLTCISAFLLACLTAPAFVSAEDSNTWVVEESKASYEINDSVTAEVENKELETSLSVTKEGKELLEETTQLSTITDLILVEETLVVIYRADGSAQSLYFDAYDLSNGKKVFESEAYDRSTFELSGKELIIQYPILNEDSIDTEPEALAEDAFTIAGGDVTKGKTEETISLQNTVTSQSAVNEKYKNPSYAEINRILTEEAENFDIPPEIVKAIAYQESGWQQYWDPGRTPVTHYQNSCTPSKTRGIAWDGTNLKLGYDCIGIGIMQVSDYRFIENEQERKEEVYKLSTDIRYNIREGLKILESKWNYANYDLIPTVNDGDRDVIENWYFAILAYNGISERNNPITNGYIAYQEKIYDRMRNYGLFNVTPFPTHKLNPYQDGIMRFKESNVETTGPLHTTKHDFGTGEKVYVTAGSLNVRKAPNSTVVTSLKRGEQVTVTGAPIGYNSNTQHWAWYPVKTTSGKTGYVASSYLSATQEPDSYRLSGINRYETSTALSNYGWHWNEPNVAVIGRGDLPIDSLTGSVLAAYHNSPLLLTQTDQLPATVEKELERMDPAKIYLLGSEGAVSASVESQLKQKYGSSNVERLSGANRFETAYEVADEVADKVNVDEIFITTSDETSTDALSIAPYAGDENTPILLTLPYKLEDNVINFIRENGVEKATIVGGTGAVHQTVENQLKGIVDTVERVSGPDRYSTSVQIAEKYFNDHRLEEVFFAQGEEVVDALAGSPLAASYEAPILLTRKDNVPSTVKNYLNHLPISPENYYLGGNAAISEEAEVELESIRR
ncbi:cell wall-binding repeat-containing protein [Halobacillus kuroshimensis]|uniref:Cell wall-binding repeat-containing protein n=1 Tax=Halobacillus kuroshimensis TaxID=302481 RepID=A0ABS3DUX7_9BACI|nr:cell wall-binding repeat-containing protein [Halobacillus kuroshimensis]